MPVMPELLEFLGLEGCFSLFFIEFSAMWPVAVAVVAALSYGYFRVKDLAGKLSVSVSFANAFVVNGVLVLRVDLKFINNSDVSLKIGQVWGTVIWNDCLETKVRSQGAFLLKPMGESSMLVDVGLDMDESLLKCLPEFSRKLEVEFKGFVKVFGLAVPVRVRRKIM